jgi:hypothetical protein
MAYSSSDVIGAADQYYAMDQFVSGQSFNPHGSMLSYGMHSQHIQNQTIPSPNIMYPIAEEHCFVAIPFERHINTTYEPVSSSSLSATPYLPNLQGTLHNFSDGPGIATSSMDPPAKKRKKKAPTLRADQWEPYRDRIKELHIDQNLPLREVKNVIEREFGFTAVYASVELASNLKLTFTRERQYRTQISRWGWDKNIKYHEMEAIVRKQQQRKLVETEKGRLRFTVRKRNVDPVKIRRWMEREGITEDALFAPSPIECKSTSHFCYLERVR